MAEQKPSYEEQKDLVMRNLSALDKFYFASLSKSPEHGREGQIDGLYVALTGIDGNSIKHGLKRQGLTNILNGDGLNARYDLSNEIAMGARIYEESLDLLKAKDLAAYIQARLGVDIEARSDKTLAELKEGSDEEKAYADYLLGQERNTIMRTMVPVAYQERAKDLNEVFNKRYPK